MKLSLSVCLLSCLWLCLLSCLQVAPAQAETIELSGTREYYLKSGGHLFTTRETVDPLLAVPEPGQLLAADGDLRRQFNYWMQITLVNHTAETEWVLDTSNIIAEQIVLNAQNRFRQQIATQGFRRIWPFDLRYGLALQLPSNAVTRIWINIQSPFGAVNPVFSIMPNQQYQEKTFSYSTQMLIAIGALVILSVYQILIFIPTRDWAYFWSALFQLAGALGWAAQSKTLLYGLSIGAHGALLYLPVFIAAVAVIAFARCYLKLSHPHLLARLLDGIALLIAIGGLTGLLLPSHLYPVLLHVAVAIAALTLLGAGLWRMQQGFAATRFYLAGSAILLLSGTVYLLDQWLRLGLIENGILLATRVQVLIMFAFMLGLIERMNLLQRTRPQRDTRTATDPVTGMPNRAAFERDVRAWEAYCKEGILKDFYLTFFEVVSLRQTNSTRGQKEGDRLLLLIGQWLSRQTGNHNVYRIGGDEFVVLTQKPVQWDLAPLYKILQKEGFKDREINIGCSCFSESSGRSSLLKLADDRLHGIPVE